MSIYGADSSDSTISASLSAPGSKLGGGGGGAKQAVASAVEAAQANPKASCGGVTLLALIVLYVAWPDACPAPGGGPLNTGHKDTLVIHGHAAQNKQTGEIHFVKSSPMQLQRAYEFHKVRLTKDYKVQFDITPGATKVKQWANIIHFTATGDNCCKYGDRVPAVWFYPGTRKLHVIDGHGADKGGNDECSPKKELEVGKKYTIRIEMREKFVEVYVNDVMLCTEKRHDRKEFGAAQVFAADPFYQPADAVIDNFSLLPLKPVPGCADIGGCNYDIRASDLADTSSCIYPTQKVCPGSMSVFTDPSSGGTVLMRGPQRLTRNLLLTKGGVSGSARGSQHVIVDIPMDYRISFTLTPDAQKVRGWASILHVTGTAENCCEYGDRIPAIWFHPNSHRLHIRDGHKTQGNAGCDPVFELTPLRAHAIQVDVGQAGVEVQIDRKIVCTAPRVARKPWKNAHVYISDPWHAAALASIQNVVLAPLQPRSGCMIDAACNRDQRASVSDMSQCIWPPTASPSPPNNIRQMNDCTGSHQIVVTPPKIKCTASQASVAGRGCNVVTQYKLKGTGQLNQYQEDLSSNSGGSGGLHAVIHVPMDYSISFIVTPTAVATTWANIFHVSATGANCCQYGDRIPAVWCVHTYIFAK